MRPGSLAALLQAMPALCRKALGAPLAAEAAELLLAEQPDLVLEQEDCELLIQAALDRGNLRLALSVHDCMQQARRGGPASTAARRAQAAAASTSSALASATASVDGAVAWPPATLRTTGALVLGLCRQLAIDQALATVADIRAQGLPRNDAVGFGKVVTSPLAPTRTLTVVQPQEGLKLVADAFSRYEYELFSGRVLTVKSEALQPSAGLLQAALRALGVLRRPPAAAVHEYAVQAPDGTSRTFRVATPTADVPAQRDERVTFVCAPSPATARSAARKRRGNALQAALFAPSPPDTRPGEALTATNHQTGVVTPLLPPPTSAAQAGAIPSWVLPAAVLLAGGDAASSLLDPALPALIAAAAVGVTGSVVAGDRLLIPKLKQLPEKALGLEYVRQQLLGQYAQLSDKADAVLAEAAEDVRVLARLWQLQNKMQSVSAVGAGAAPAALLGAGGGGGVATATGGGAAAAAAAASSSYVARMERVALARAGVEARLSGRLELLDGYTRVMNMIEIEVEMDIEVPAAELAGIEEQMVRLQELEGLQDEWRVQAEARDEVRRAGGGKGVLSRARQRGACEGARLLTWCGVAVCVRAQVERLLRAPS